MSTHLMILLPAILGFVSSSNDCHACLDGYCHTKITILRDYHFSGQLVIDRAENIVYFHYEDSQNNDHTVAYYLNNFRFNFLPNIDFSFAKAVDQSSRDVYLGLARGIYKYNPITNKTIDFGLSDKTVWRMQYKNKIYFAVLKTKGLFTYEKKQSKMVPKLSNYTIEDFVIDYRDDIYFLSQSIVHRLRKGANTVTAVANDISSISIDKFGSPYFVNTAKRGLYKSDRNTDELVEVGAFGSSIPLKFVFDDSNNIVYMENNNRMNLYYFMANYGRCLVSRKPHGRPMMKSTGRDGNQRYSELVIQRIKQKL